MTAIRKAEPSIPDELVSRILHKLEIDERPKLDLAGLNMMQAAYACHVPNDNIRKRIWLVGDKLHPLPGGDPVEFFETWLDCGTGGTCFPSNGALCCLLRAVGFDAHRISGAVLMEGIEQDGNHGAVVVAVGGIDYLVDAQLAAFKALPLMSGHSATTGNGIHDIKAVPTADGFDVHWTPGSNRHKTLIMRPDLKTGAVDHDYFLAQYSLSASKKRRRSPFNDALFIGRHFPEKIVIVSRNTRTEVSADNTVAKSQISDAERARILIEDLGISELIVREIPPDETE